jgi:hypothetical protein
MEHPDKVVLMPLKSPTDIEYLNELGFRQVKIYDIELEIMAHRLGKSKDKVIQLSDEFKIPPG